MPRTLSKQIRLFLAVILSAAVLFFAFEVATGQWQYGVLFLPVLAFQLLALLATVRSSPAWFFLRPSEPVLAASHSRAPPA
jgi:hypothetical protein